MGSIPSFYAKPGLNTETYDARTALEGTAVDGDVAFYVGQAREAEGPVLEIASGTGRVTWAFGQAGHDVVGLELSPAMIAVAEAKRGRQPAEVARRVKFVHGDMVDFDLDAVFDLIVVPFRAFQSILSPEDQRRALESMGDHLTARGRLVLDLFDPRLEYCLPEEDRAPRRRSGVKHPERRSQVEIEVAERRNDPLRQVLEERWVFREVDGSGRVLREEEEMLRLRWTYRWEMRYLLELAGLEVVAEHSDFKGSPPAYGNEQVWVVRRP